MLVSPPRKLRTPPPALPPRAPEHRELAREAVRKSLVLLKNGKSTNKPLLPLPKHAPKILVAGTHADDIGKQCGGWTLQWQRQSGNITSGTTILSAIKSTVYSTTEVVYSENPDSGFVQRNKFSHAVVVVGEPPYGETFGDSLNLTLPEPAPSIIRSVCGSVKCVVVLITGRPVVIQPYLGQIDGLVAAWLPGSEGQGVADVLFGDYGFTGRLARTWFKSVDQLPITSANLILLFLRQGRRGLLLLLRDLGEGCCCCDAGEGRRGLLLLLRGLLLLRRGRGAARVAAAAARVAAAATRARGGEGCCCCCETWARVAAAATPARGGEGCCCCCDAVEGRRGLLLLLRDLGEGCCCEAVAAARLKAGCGDTDEGCCWLVGEGKGGRAGELRRSEETRRK